MKVLDLYKGFGGWSQAFKDREHEVVTVDINPKFNPDICKDIFTLTTHDLETYGKFDVILASPPCEHFSVASISKNWTGGIRVYEPKTEETCKAIALVKHTLQLIEQLNPRFWVLENPMGVLRKLPFMAKYHHRLVTYCQYGEHIMKPTDLWGKFPLTFAAKSCKNGASCHDRAPREAKTGTQGLKDSASRAKIPYGLSLAICIACEKAINQSQPDFLQSTNKGKR